jgi:hypothetical protein
MKQYLYTLYKQDGTIEVLPISKKKSFNEIYKILGCEMIEVIPSDYYPDGFGQVTVYGDEEGRFNSNNKRNPHFKVLKGDPNIEPVEWDTVGDLLKEEVYKGDK